MFYRPWPAIILFGALAAGRFSVVSVRDVGLATRLATHGGPCPGAGHRETVSRSSARPGEPVVARESEPDPSSTTQTRTDASAAALRIS